MPISRAALYFMRTYVADAASWPISKSTNPGRTPARSMRAFVSARTSAAIALPSMIVALTGSPVTEVADAGEHHWNAVLVRRADHLGVVDRPARLDDGRRARDRAGVQPVAEREEGVARHHRAFRAIARLARRDLRRVNA